MGEVSLRDRRRTLLDRDDLGGAELCRAYAAEADAWLSILADRATGGDPRHLALVAVGGYGRGELCPFSDLDVVLVHDGRKDVAALAEAIWYPVWDQGVRLDHSVRRPAEVLAAAGDDLRVALGLLDARMVWGDARVAEPLLSRALDLWRSRLGATWLPALAEQTEARRRTHGDVAFLLEPDLKESHGGLRDVNVLRAIAAYAPLLADYVDLASLEPATTTLTKVRVELHRRAGRALDRLLLQEQDHVAQILSYPDADALMAAVSEAGRAVAWVSEDAWRRRRFWQPDPVRRKRRLLGARAGQTARPAWGRGPTHRRSPGWGARAGQTAQPGRHLWARWGPRLRRSPPSPGGAAGPRAGQTARPAWGRGPTHRRSPGWGARAGQTARPAWGWGPTHRRSPPSPGGAAGPRAGQTAQPAWGRGPTHRRSPGWGARAGQTAQPAVEVEPGVGIVGGEVALTSAAPVASDSSLPLRLAAVAAERDLPIARAALHRLADRMAPPPDPWPVETRQALVRVLAAGRPAVDALESLDQQGLLVRILPEWGAVRNKPQRNAYHRFTVDRHLLEAAANAAALADRVDRPDLLVVGSLLHDIGKGYPGDHTVVGTELVETIARRMGFPPADVATLVSLCRHHLLLPDTATRRDLDDPATVETVARAAGDRQTLELLAALTEADGLATGPSAWGSWKAGLVADLVERTARHLDGHRPAGRRPAAGGARVTDLHRRMMEEVRAGGRPAVLLDPPHVVVAAPDRPGLLASVAGVLALHGLDVRSADAAGEDGVATEVFTVEVGRRSWPDSARLREDLDAVLSDRLALGDRLAAKAEAYAGRHRPSAARPVVPQVVVDNTASATSTVVEVRAADELGLLHRVTRALFDCDLDVVSARASTLGDAVVDAFYVRDASGAKVTDPGVLDLVERTLRAAVT